MDNYGGMQIIDQKTWNSGSLIFHICFINNENSYLIAQNDRDNKYYPNKYSRFEWVEDSSFRLWYAQQVYDADTIEDAKSFMSYPRADSSDPSKGGVGKNNYPWTKMTKLKNFRSDRVIPSIAGQYDDNYGGSHIVNQYAWQSDLAFWHICSTNNETREIIAQNDEHNSYYPGKYSRFEWVIDEADSLWYCQQVYDANTENAAALGPRADSRNPSVGGAGFPINNFPWTKLMKKTFQPLQQKKENKHETEN